MAVQAAGISEIFSSLQGEGTHMGERHLFVRFEACNIHCEYCDELGKFGHDLDLESTLEGIRGLEREKGPHHAVSLTGGEPLLYTAFLKQLLPRLKRDGFKLYLETNGILWKSLEELISGVDVVAMDVKPASVTKERSFLEEHRQFLKFAIQKETFIKMVCSREIDFSEFKELCEMVRSVSATVPLLLQPISGAIEGHEDAVLMRLLDELQTIASGLLQNVRVVPRLHKILGIR
jgi:7-carboxy-7-deazaguanine synthase